MGNKVQFTPPAKALRPPSEADVAAVANGESLQLLETWQGSFMGSKLIKAGLTLKHGLAGSLIHHSALFVSITWTGIYTYLITVPWSLQATASVRCFKVNDNPSCHQLFAGSYLASV